MPMGPLQIVVLTPCLVPGCGTYAPANAPCLVHRLVVPGPIRRAAEDACARDASRDEVLALWERQRKWLIAESKASATN